MKRGHSTCEGRLKSHAAKSNSGNAFFPRGNKNLRDLAFLQWKGAMDENVQSWPKGQRRCCVSWHSEMTLGDSIGWALKIYMKNIFYIVIYGFVNISLELPYFWCKYEPLRMRVSFWESRKNRRQNKIIGKTEEHRNMPCGPDISSEVSGEKTKRAVATPIDPRQ
jgi:hypothetical protein